MLTVTSWLYAAQLFFMTMSVLNLALGIASVFGDGDNTNGSILVVFGLAYGLISMILGMYALKLLAVQ